VSAIKSDRRTEFLRWYHGRAVRLGYGEIDAVGMAYAIGVDSLTGNDGAEHYQAVVDFRHLGRSARIAACSAFLRSIGRTVQP